MQEQIAIKVLIVASADVISWDFGMTDGRTFHKKALFANRAGVHRNRPAIVDMNMFGKLWPERINELKVVERYGLTTFHIKEGADQAIMNGVPDMFGMSQEQIDAIPEYIRYVKCDGVIEKGEPDCSKNKWTPICPKRLHQTSWHPGWRVHAMFGFTIGLFLIDALANAIENLGPNDYDPQQKLRELKAEEDNLYKQFFETSVESARMEGFTNDNITSAIDPQVFFREPCMCHTPILPSESRYKGYFTGSLVENGAYEKGTSQDVIVNEPADGKLRVALESPERQEWCPVELKIDFKDYYYANSNDGWVNMTFPNDLEIEVYGPWKPRGVIVICSGWCAWNKCAKGDRPLNDLNDQLVEITINDISVVRLWSLSNNMECSVAQGSDGWYFPQNKDGRYDISVRVVPSNESWLAYTRITSIMAF